jgi:hypothetical protein
MDNDTVLKSAYPADVRSIRDEASPSDGSAGEVALQLTRRASLILVLLLSLGLWAAIWAAVASLASAMLG